MSCAAELGIALFPTRRIRQVYFGEFKAIPEPLDLAIATAEVESGPNRGWAYVASDEFPWAFTPAIDFNRAVFDPSDPCYRYHDGTKGRCDTRTYSGIVEEHERAHERFFIERMRNAWLDPFMEEQRSASGLGVLDERLSRLREHVLSDLVPPRGSSDPYVASEEDVIATNVPGCTIDYRAPYAGGKSGTGGPR